jgi:hypothetical protein
LEAFVNSVSRGLVLSGVLALCACGKPGGTPQEVTDLVARIQNCHHFAGEYGDDPTANRGINREMDKAKCATVDADEAAMRAKYASDDGVRKLLDDADKF